MAKSNGSKFNNTVTAWPGQCRMKSPSDRITEALASTNISDPPKDKNVFTLCDLQDTVLLRILGKLAVTELARASLVSHQFYQLAGFLLSRWFKKPDSESYDFLKLYPELKRIEYRITRRHTLEGGACDGLCVECNLCDEHGILKRFLETLLDDQKTDTELTGEACLSNQKIEFFKYWLLESRDLPVHATDIQEFLDDPLAELVLRYKNLDGKFCFITAKDIKRYGVSLFKDKVDLWTIRFVVWSGVLDEDRETRRQMFGLLTDISDTMRVLIETEDLMGTRLSSTDVDIAEFFYISKLITDEASCDRALTLSEHFILDCTTECMIWLLASPHINTQFIVKILKFLEQCGHSLFKHVLFLNRRVDAEAIYRGIYPIDDILQSIELNTSAYSSRQKIECALMLGIEDQVLLPIIKDAKKLPCLAELIWMAIKKKRSVEVVSALRGKTPRDVDPIFNSGRIVDRDFLYDFELSLDLDYGPEEIEVFCQMAIGTQKSWTYSLSDASRLPYFLYLLDAGKHVDGDLLVPKIFREADEPLFKKIFRSIMKTGCSNYSWFHVSTDVLEYKFRDYIREALDEGIVPHNMFKVSYERNLPLSRIQKIVLEEVLPMENGFFKLVCFDDYWAMKENMMDFMDIDVRIVAGTIIRTAIIELLDIEIGDLCDNKGFKDMVLIAVLSHLSGQEICEMYLKDYEEEQDLKRFIDGVRSDRPAVWDSFITCIYLTYPHGLLNSEECLAAMSPFRKILYDCLLRPGLCDVINEAVEIINTIGPYRPLG